MLVAFVLTINTLDVVVTFFILVDVVVVVTVVVIVTVDVVVFDLNSRASVPVCHLGHLRCLCGYCSFVFSDESVGV